MQSGITASKDLQDAFNTFTSDSSFFALPITIDKESLSPLSPIPFTSSDFNASLPSLKEHLGPKTPIYLMLRPSPQQNHGLIAVTYVPSTAPVRQKMLFASTRSTLVRDLGLEKFGDSVFATDDFEVLDPEQWRSRGKSGSGLEAVGAANNREDDILSREERELATVKRAEEEERHGTQGRDLMGAGGSGGSSLAMKTTDDASEALRTLSNEGAVVLLTIDIPTETLQLLSQSTDTSPSTFLSAIPPDRPSYAFYTYPGAPAQETIFLYTNPSSAGVKVRERMVYASARAGVLGIVGGEGVRVTRRLEQGDVGEVGVGRLESEVGLVQDGGQGGAAGGSGASKQGFARPKRPGKR